jgi:hypothetical protein
MPGFDGYLYDPSSLPKVDHVQHLLSENLVLEGPNASGAGISLAASFET